MRPSHLPSVGDLAVPEFRTPSGHRFFLPAGLIPHQEKSLRSGRVYEPATSDAIRRLTRPGMHVVECGACCGYHALTLATSVGPTGRLVCFEANPELIPILRRNMHANQLAAMTDIINMGVWDSPGTRAFSLPKKRLGSASFLTMEHAATWRRLVWRLRMLVGVSPSDSIKTFLPIPVVSLDSYFGQQRVDLIRMDIEGAELPAILGARELLRRHRPTLIFEWVPWHQSRAESQRLFALLGSLGYHLYRLLDIGPASLHSANDLHERYVRDGRAVYRDVACTQQPMR